MPHRLVLYSQQQAPQSDAIDARLLELLPARRGTIAYIPSSPDRARSWFSKCEQHYAAHGIALEYLGLEDEFEATRFADLSRFDAIHLSGGNTFQFLHWLRTRGVLPLLQRYATEGGLLIGVSAGAILMTRDISSAALCGDIPYPALTATAGLALVDFALVPHFDGSASHRASLTRFAKQHAVTVCGLPDNCGIIINGPHIETIGPVILT